MDKTSLIAVDKRHGPVINLETIERIDPKFDPNEAAKIVGITVRHTSGALDIYCSTAARRIVNALNAKFKLELGA